MLNTWVVMPTCLPLVLRRCHACASERFRTSGKFRVNANHKLIDAWLLALCTVCGETAKLTVLERRNVRSVQPGLLDRLHDNDPGLAAELLQDPAVRRRNRIALDWDGAWRLDTGGSDPLDRGRGLPRSSEAESLGKSDVSVRFAARIPVRPVRLVAEGCGLSRAEVERLIAEGKLVSVVRLNARLSGDFTFTLKH
ncbi:DUF1062 domain-containing protein [Streptomyces sp. PRKS01-29]|nr:DUF1062 domain-containing protein [Streptomyces sabulosicollis]MBI0296020.1 DUF1062 domain-containing protein [Streptomyces sabulosicollis]